MESQGDANATKLGPVAVVVHEDQPGRFAYADLPGHDKWTITAHFVEQDGAWVIDQLTISCTDNTVPPGGLTTRLLRDVSLGVLARRLERRPLGSLLRPANHIAQQHRRDPHPGRRGRDDLYYSCWAALYHQHAQQSQHPIATLATELGISQARVRDHIRNARNRGLLTPAPRGRSGGELTDYAHQLLDGDHP
jgi:hypothetical protein